jgi:hypothetical protein
MGQSHYFVLIGDMMQKKKKNNEKIEYGGWWGW